MSSAPPPLPSAGLSPAAIAPSGSEKKVVWIVVAAFLGVLMLVVLFIGAIATAVFAGMRASDPYRFALHAATSDARVLSRLGSPVKPGWLITGSINVRNDSGDADLSIPLQGTVHRGAIHVVASKSEGQWTYQKLTLKVEDGLQSLDLLEPAGATPQEK